MPANFRSVVTDLWTSLGEPPPDFDEDGAVQLDSDELSLRFEEWVDGRRLLVTTEVGRLAANPILRSDQIRRILSDNLGFLLTRRACVHLRAGGEEPPVLTISGLHPYDDRLSMLSDLVDDVLFLRRWHAEALGEPLSFSRRPVQEDHGGSDVIFRP